MTRLALISLLVLAGCEGGFEGEMNGDDAGGLQWACFGWCTGFYVDSEGRIQIDRDQTTRVDP